MLDTIHHQGLCFGFRRISNILYAEAERPSPLSTKKSFVFNMQLENHRSPAGRKVILNQITAIIFNKPKEI
jgi:hypothetical protein